MIMGSRSNVHIPLFYRLASGFPVCFIYSFYLRPQSTLRLVADGGSIFGKEENDSGGFYPRSEDWH